MALEISGFFYIYSLLLFLLSKITFQYLILMQSTLSIQQARFSSSFKHLK